MGVALLEWVLKLSISARYIRPTSHWWIQPEMVGVALLNMFRWSMCLDNWSLDNWLPIRYCWRKSPHTYQTTAKGKMTSPTPWRHVWGHSEWQLMVENNDNGYTNYQRCPKGVWKSHQLAARNWTCQELTPAWIELPVLVCSRVSLNEYSASWKVGNQSYTRKMSDISLKLLL